MQDFVAVIMAGGVGQRFWPLSTAEHPKQFLDVERCGRSLLQATYDRLLPLLASPERLLVVTGTAYAQLVAEQLPEVSPECLLLEPVGRDTAPAAAYAALVVQERWPDALIGMFPADHHIGSVAAFQQAVRDAMALARRSHGIVTLGMKPDRAATGYGYIERGDAVAGGFKVARFVEKPDASRAREYVASGRYSWNGGVFVWSAATVLGELERHAPEVFLPLVRAWREGSIEAVYPTLPKRSIDYAVMEKTERAFVVPADFGWDDVGDWVALERVLNRFDRDANTVQGRHVGLDTSGNIIYAQDEADMIVTLGIENLVVVKLGNTVLLVKKDRVQDLKLLLADARLQAWAVMSVQPPESGSALRRTPDSAPLRVPGAAPEGLSPGS